MGRLLTTILMILTVSSTVGCYSCMQGSYYDPCSGVVYGPSIQPPGIFSGLKKSKHDEKNCPLCRADAASGVHTPSANCGPNCNHGTEHAEDCVCGQSHATPVNGAVNPACYGAAFGAEPGCEAPAPVSTQCGCAAPHPAHVKSDCTCGTSSGGCGCTGHEVSASWSPTIDTLPRCTACGQVVHDSIPADCPTCATLPGEYSPSDIIYDSHENHVYSDSTMLPGELVLPETFAPSDCPTCHPNVSGPIFEGTIVPNDSAASPDSPTPEPAPPAESDHHHSHEHDSTPGAAPLETVPGATPEPNPLPATTLLIPAESTLQPARHVHWVPNALK